MMKTTTLLLVACVWLCVLTTTPVYANETHAVEVCADGVDLGGIEGAIAEGATGLHFGATVSTPELSSSSITATSSSSTTGATILTSEDPDAIQANLLTAKQTLTIMDEMSAEHAWAADLFVGQPIAHVLHDIQVQSTVEAGDFVWSTVIGLCSANDFAPCEGATGALETTLVGIAVTGAGPGSSISLQIDGVYQVPESKKRALLPGFHTIPSPSSGGSGVPTSGYVNIGGFLVLVPMLPAGANGSSADNTGGTSATPSPTESPTESPTQTPTQSPTAAPTTVCTAGPAEVTRAPASVPPQEHVRVVRDTNGVGVRFTGKSALAVGTNFGRFHDASGHGQTGSCTIEVNAGTGAITYGSSISNCAGNTDRGSVNHYLSDTVGQARFRVLSGAAHRFDVFIKTTSTSGLPKFGVNGFPSLNQADQVESSDWYQVASDAAGSATGVLDFVLAHGGADVEVTEVAVVPYTGVEITSAELDGLAEATVSGADLAPILPPRTPRSFVTFEDEALSEEEVALQSNLPPGPVYVNNYKPEFVREASWGVGDATTGSVSLGPDLDAYAGNHFSPNLAYEGDHYVRLAGNEDQVASISVDFDTTGMVTPHLYFALKPIAVAYPVASKWAMDGDDTTTFEVSVPVEESVPGKRVVTSACGVGGLLITELVDGNRNGQLPRWIEVTNTSPGAISLGDYKLVAHRTSGTTTTDSVTLSAVELAASSSYVVNFETGATAGSSDFFTVYSADPDQHGDDNFITGVEAVQLVYVDPDTSDETIVDVFGVVGEDGGSQAWGYEDGYVSRNSDVLDPSTTYDASQWSELGIQAADDASKASELVSNTSPGSHEFEAGEVPVPSESTNVLMRLTAIELSSHDNWHMYSLTLPLGVSKVSFTLTVASDRRHAVVLDALHVLDHAPVKAVHADSSEVTETRETVQTARFDAQAAMLTISGDPGVPSCDWQAQGGRLTSRPLGFTGELTSTSGTVSTTPAAACPAPGVARFVLSGFTGTSLGLYASAREGTTGDVTFVVGGDPITVSSWSGWTTISASTTFAAHANGDVFIDVHVGSNFIGGFDEFIVLSTGSLNPEALPAFSSVTWEDPMLPRRRAAFSGFEQVLPNGHTWPVAASDAVATRSLSSRITSSEAGHLYIPSSVALESCVGVPRVVTNKLRPTESDEPFVFPFEGNHAAYLDSTQSSVTVAMSDASFLDAEGEVEVVVYVLTHNVEGETSSTITATVDDVTVGSPLSLALLAENVWTEWVISVDAATFDGTDFVFTAATANGVYLDGIHARFASGVVCKQFAEA